MQNKKLHNYKVDVEWVGNEGSGTSNYKAYNRNHLVKVQDKYDIIKASSDPSFLGDASKYNPEELFLASLSSCHMLWYLHLCATNKIVVVEYVDNATGKMEELNNGSGKFTEVILNPTVKITSENNVDKAIELHHKANQFCFIANSCNFKIQHQPKIVVENQKV